MLHISVSSHKVVLRRLMQCLGVTTKAALGRRIGVGTQAIVNAIARGEIPEAWIYKVGYESRTSIDWIRTGQGPRELPFCSAETKSGVPQERPGELQQGPNTKEDETLLALLSVCRGLTRKELETVVRCGYVLQEGDKDSRRHLIDELKYIEKKAVSSDIRRSGRKASPTG